MFVDTPGLHKPVSALGERLNRTASEAFDGVDVVCLVLDATQPFGRGDRCVAARLPARLRGRGEQDRPAPAGRRSPASWRPSAELDAEAYFPVSARTGDGRRRAGRAPRGPAARGAAATTPPTSWPTCPRPQWVAELVREQLLRVTRDELPYSIATRVTEWEWPRIRVEILVERESQKGMVIGKGGAVLKEAGTQARRQLPAGRPPRAVRQGRQGLAAPPRPRRATGVLMPASPRRVRLVAGASPGARRASVAGASAAHGSVTQLSPVCDGPRALRW